MYNIFSAPFMESYDIKRLCKSIREGVSPCSVFGVSDASKPLLSVLGAGQRRILYITSSQEKATAAAADMESYTGRACVCLPQR